MQPCDRNDKVGLLDVAFLRHDSSYSLRFIQYPDLENVANVAAQKGKAVFSRSTLTKLFAGCRGVLQTHWQAIVII